MYIRMIKMRIVIDVWKHKIFKYTGWFKYDRDWFVQTYSQFVPVIFEPPCMLSRMQIYVKSATFDTSKFTVDWLYIQARTVINLRTYEGGLPGHMRTAVAVM